MANSGMTPPPNGEPRPSEWQELGRHIRHYAAESLRVITILVLDFVLVIAGFLTGQLIEFVDTHWLHLDPSEPFSQLPIRLSWGLFLLLYVITVAVHIVNYVKGEFGAGVEVIGSNPIAPTIELTVATRKSLSAGKEGPDFGLQIPFGMRSQMSCYVGNPNEEVLSWLGRILSQCKRIPKDSFYAEVALTHVPALMFYELFSL